MYTIATLHEMHRHLQLAPDDNSADQDLLRSLQEASHYLESATQRRFCPRFATVRIEYDPAEPGEIVLPDDLLELQAILDQSGEIDARRIRRLPQEADQPASVLQIHGGIEGAATIRGFWGWHDRWKNSWRDSGERLFFQLQATHTTLTVADADGKDASGASPRFQVGQLLRIGSEYLRIIDIDSAGRRLTMLRGVNGAPASAHPSRLGIDIYAPPPAVVDLCLRYAELLMRPGSFVDEEAPELLRLRRLRL